MGQCRAGGDNNGCTDLMVIPTVSTYQKHTVSRKLASVTYTCHCGTNYTALKKGERGYFAGCDRACSLHCAKNAQDSQTDASPGTHIPPHPDAIQKWMRRRINEYSQSKVSMIMAARVPSADGAHDTLIVGAEDEDIASILRYFLLLKATGTTNSIRTLRQLAASCKDGTADGFFRLASVRLGDAVRPTRTRKYARDGEGEAI